MKKIPLTQGKFALVDDADFERLSQFKWCVNGRGYAEAWDIKNKKTFRMHRFLMGFPEDKNIDHINGNKIDNRIINLRVCTQQGNTMNMSVHKDNPTGYKGVSWDKAREKYEACIRVNKRKKFLGRFDTAVEAAKAYNKAAKESYGEFSRPNKILQEAK